ncbi:alpha/beta hydrolase fold [Halalkalibacter wakoensis JCM 9140]|uniref:Alpha/beta hydrolase fold n=1 Tax=Halalkalibacter wakoensis JCM 9140 TaxID=1236970 RepID=W4Q5Z8_9BACI|nr:alpha/beta hydrolase [Halalkalibacter wakoensis]GAE27385.1 alpha/beta hydrolase fold [Halalkalibacter wakoensis JCM 9140]
MKNDGPTFLFIHGAGGTQSKWRLIKEAFTSDEATFIDLPGRKKNAELSERTIREFSSALSSSIGEDTIVVGHSMGGLIAMDLAIKNPNVKGIVLVASHFHLPVHEKVLNQLENGTFPEGLFFASYSKQADTKLLEEEKEELSLVDMNQIFIDFSACNDYKNGKETFAELQVPILIIYGDEDRMLPKDSREQVLALNKHTSIKTIEKSGHYVMLEQPEKLLVELRNFQKEVSVLKGSEIT